MLIHDHEYPQCYCYNLQPDASKPHAVASSCLAAYHPSTTQLCRGVRLDELVPIGLDRAENDETAMLDNNRNPPEVLSQSN